METRDLIRHRQTAVALRGVLILGMDGKQLIASGIAEQREMATRIVAGWHDARRRERRLFSVEGPDTSSVVVVVLPATDATILIAMVREGRDALFEFVGSVDFASDILAHFLTNPFEALTVVDREGTLRYMSPVHERFFGMNAGSGIGRPVTEVIENTNLHQVAATGKAEIGSLQEMRGVTRVVTRHPIVNGRGDIVGAIGQVMFKGPEQLQAFSNELAKLKSEVAYYRRELKDLKTRGYGLDQIIGESLTMQRLKQQIIKVAPLDVPVLLTGESGTGKELAAHAIHKLSVRRDAALVMVNAAALPSTLVESELFGYEAGSFTGAERKGRRGQIEQADGGSLFFDEVGDMPAEVQVKLLRVLQDGSFQRVGGNEPKHSNFRLISASNRDFESMIEEGTFRLDLFYRIGAVVIRMPTLRERLDDIPLLAGLALRNFAERHGQQPKTLSDAALAFLAEQSWPGNVRQLMHVVERAAIFSESDVIEAEDFGLTEPAGMDIPVRVPTHGVAGRLTAPIASPDTMRVSSAVEQVEEQMIRKAMAQFDGNKKRVASSLGISRSYLYKRLAQMGMGA
ncbi:sigma-54 interaction domain-containing protein [Burkholderia multivorans]|uniref:sigma-54 interaction domain-containing protein n=1 Tax=Burkholderia multivorans TaxID=87883 RepID=UPI00201844B0|nr:sigma 54-interacting transcriptional regulator [Burkholderia multivorans]MCO1367012.1 sigma 54-interacting transcriptional regulator [Burkholderia multivorans]MCO1376621.1 sigma 54-interacting transcriptional regulator [Burkholderia multivorans]UQP18575.1 sigma 54-interacting transcriptional regulator [Burkholderia multivorans]UQP86544.1 sigma 54-interacting transcriptional regulator [Burkholderia multivorans]